VLPFDFIKLQIYNRPITSTYIVYMVTGQLPTNQLAVSQAADWSTCGLVNSLKR